MIPDRVYTGTAKICSQKADGFDKVARDTHEECPVPRPDAKMIGNRDLPLHRCKYNQRHRCVAKDQTKDNGALLLGL